MADNNTNQNTRDGDSNNEDDSLIDTKLGFFVEYGK